MGSGSTIAESLTAKVGFNHSLIREKTTMTDQDQADSGEVPMMQKLLDNPFLLLFLGVASPALLYLVWGLVEIMTVPLR